MFRWGVVYKMCGEKTWADLVSRWLLFKKTKKQAMTNLDQHIKKQRHYFTDEV